jgi:hypothetical protein|tara:strand:- start:3055 stop:3252 length:198 start_codon:yes stop_codon:yes gene_type:complete
MKKKILSIVGLIAVGLCSVSCNTTNAKIGLPIPFTNPPVKVEVDTQVTPLPPKICVGLNVSEVEG